MEESVNFWDGLTSAWKNQGTQFLQGLPGFIAQSGLNLGAGWLAGLIGNQLDFNSYRNKADYQYMLSEKMAENAYNRQLDFWKKQNDYNTPAAMVGRMAEAGLNPAQSITPQPAGNLSSVSTPMPSASSSRPNIEAGLRSFGEILTSVKQMGLLDKETELKAKELISKQLDNDLKSFARAAGFSEAFISEMDRRAQWASLYGDETPIPDNPFVQDLFPASMERNPFEQNYRKGEQEIATSKALERVHEAEEALANAKTDTEKNKAATELALAARAWADAKLLEAQERYTIANEEYLRNKDKRESELNEREWAQEYRNKELYVWEKDIKELEAWITKASLYNLVADTDLKELTKRMNEFQLEIAELKSNPATDMKTFARKWNILIHDFAGNILSAVGN